MEDKKQPTNEYDDGDIPQVDLPQDLFPETVPNKNIPAEMPPQTYPLEMPTDIIQPRRAQQRIHQRVERHIRIGMPQQPQGVGHLHPAEDQIPPLNQLMHIIP